MSRSRNNNIEIATIQFELWQNCDNNCPWCYLREGRVIADPNKMICNIDQACEILDDKERMKQYNGIGLIGGEFFQGQLSTPELKSKFLSLISKINSMILSGEIIEAWITASLTKELPQDLIDTLNCFSFEQFSDNNRVFLCTSYDTDGRFRDKQHKELWYNNLKKIRDIFPEQLYIHTQIITTQAFLEEVESGEFSFERIGQYSSVDYKLPGGYRVHYTDELRDTKKYIEYLRTIKNSFPPKFFIESRASFLKFLEKVARFYGAEKLKQFATNKARSMTLISFSDSHTILDRWDEHNSHENAEVCGHPYDSFCYLDSDNCSRCDALQLYDILTKEMFLND